MRMRGARRFQAGGVNTPSPTMQQIFESGGPAGRRAPDPRATQAFLNSPYARGLSPSGGPGGPAAANQAAAMQAMNAARSAGAPPPIGGATPTPPAASLGPMAPPVGGAGTGAFTAGAPGNGLGAAPGLNPQAIQQALMQRRSMAGGPPALGGPAGVPAAGFPGGAPAPFAGGPGVPPPGGASLGPLAGGAPPPNMLAGLASGMGPGAAPPMNQFGPMMQAPAMGMGFAKGGAVAEDGDTDAKKRRSDRQWGENKVAEDLPAPVKKAKGGVLRRKPPKPKVAAAKPPVPTPSPYDYEGPDGTPVSGAAPPGPGPAAPMAAPGMKKGGKWIQDAIKKPGSLRKALGTPKGENIPAKKLAKAAKSKGKLGEKARLAETLKGFKKAKGGECDDKMAQGGISKFDSTANLPRKKKFAAGGAAKERRHFPNTIKPPKKFAEGGRIRGCGVATKGCKFSGIY